MLVIDHYELEIRRLTKFGGIVVRPFLKRMEARKAMAVTDFFVKIFFPLHYAVRNYYPLQMVLSRISPCAGFSYPELSKEETYQLCRLDTFDSLTDYYKRLKTKAQVERMLRNLDPLEIWVEKRVGAVIEARCIKAS